MLGVPAKQIIAIKVQPGLRCRGAVFIPDKSVADRMSVYEITNFEIVFVVACHACEGGVDVQ